MPKEVKDEARLGKLQFSLSIFILLIILQEVAQLFSLKLQYFLEVESWIKLVALLTSTLVIFARTKEDWVKHTSALVNIQ